MRQKFIKPTLSFILTAISLLGFHSFSFSQPSNKWTPEEREYYKTLAGLCQYLSRNVSHLNIDDSAKKYILLEYVLTDTSKERKKGRIEKINDLLTRFGHFIDSAGISNLEAKPIRFFKDHTKFYKPFTEELKESQPLTFAYYNKKDPSTPYGYLLFHRDTHKLVSWIVLNQGGHHYFLTFNLM